MLYRIEVADYYGDTTIRKELTEEQAKFLGEVAAEITENGGAGSTVLSVTLIVEGDYDHPETVKEKDLPYSYTEAAKAATEQIKRGLDF